MADVAPVSPIASPSAAQGASTGTPNASQSQSKVTAFQLALQAALQRPPVLADGGGTDVDNDDGTSLCVGMGSGFPMP